LFHVEHFHWAPTSPLQMASASAIVPRGTFRPRRGSHLPLFHVEQFLGHYPYPRGALHGAHCSTWNISPPAGGATCHCSTWNNGPRRLSLRAAGPQDGSLFHVDTSEVLPVTCFNKKACDNRQIRELVGLEPIVPRGTVHGQPPGPRGGRPSEPLFHVEHFAPGGAACHCSTWNILLGPDQHPPRGLHDRHCSTWNIRNAPGLPNCSTWNNMARDPLLARSFQALSDGRCSTWNLPMR